MQPTKKLPFLTSGVGQIRKLDQNFAVKLIQKQLQLQKNCSADLINQLLGLYSQAIEYLQHINDSRYQDFKTRMQNMMKRPQVLQTLNSSSRQRNAIRKESQKQDKRVNRNVRRMMRSHKIRYSSLCEKVKSNFRMQENGLERMVSKRKLRNRSLNNSYELDQPSFSQESSPVLKGSVEDLIKIDNAIQQNFLEMAGKIAEVTVQFQTEINEMGRKGKDAESLKKEMEEEIGKIKENYAVMRRQSLVRR